MGRESRSPKVAAGFDRLEVRALLSVTAPAAGDMAGLVRDVPPAEVLGKPMPAALATKPLLVAVVGSGIDLNPSDPVHYAGNANLLDLADAYNAVDGTYGQAAVADLAPGSPGTRAAGAVALGIADAVSAGGNPDVRIVPIRAYSPGLKLAPPYAVVNGIYHAVALGASVIEVGYVGSQFDLNPAQVQQLDGALSYARSVGAAVVVAAGDGFAGASSVGVDIDRPGTYYGVYPADTHQSNMLVVAAADASGRLTGSSNWGATHVDVAAPAPPADGSTGSAAGYASGVAAVLSATRADWIGIEVVNRIKQSAQFAPALAGKVTSGGVVSAANALWAIYGVQSSSTPDDFEGDLKSDLALYGNVPGLGYSFGVLSSTQGFDAAHPVAANNQGASFGLPGTIPVPGRYYGGPVTEPAILVPQLGGDGKPDGLYNFAILTQGAQGSFYVSTFVPGVGQAGDIPVAGNFTRSGRDDLALYGLHNGQYNFRVLTAASGFDPARAIYVNNNGFGFGGPGDTPVVGDFFGEGQDALGFYGPEVGPTGQPTGRYVFGTLDPGSLNARFQFTRSVYVTGFGGPGDIPIAGDFEGDGKADVALYGNFYGTYGLVVLPSSSGFNLSKLIFVTNNGASLGGPGSVPVSGDFFGNGQADAAVYGPEIGPDGQPDGSFVLTALDPKSLDPRYRFTRSLVVRNFGGPGAVPANAPPGVRAARGLLD